MATPYDYLCKTHGNTIATYQGQGNSRRLRCVACVKAAVTKRRRKLKELAIEYKGGRCKHCGYHRCHAALEFHHLDPNEKDFGIAANGATRSFDKLKKELDKCIMLCSNCHREEHEKLRETLKL